MKMLRNKSIAIIIALILATSMSISMIATVSSIGTYPIPGTHDYYDVPTYTAIQQGMYWTGMDANASATRLQLWNEFNDHIPTRCFLLAAPTPIGVGQACNIVMFNPQVPPGASETNTIRSYYTLQITKPDGTKITLPTSGAAPSYSSWAVNSVQTINGVLCFVSDATGSTYTTLIPDETGNWTLTDTYLQQQFLWNSTNTPTGVNGINNGIDYYGVTLLQSTGTYTLNVQQQPVSLTGLNPPYYTPLPTAYWTRPIEGENTGWYTVGSNWLNDEHDWNNGGYENRVQPDGTAPTSGHILWTMPTEENGIASGSNVGRPGNAYNAGSQYQPRFDGKQIILWGILYFEPNSYYSGANELWDAVDLKTGQLLYQVNATAATGNAANTPSFGYLQNSDTDNEHGIVNPGWLFSSNYLVGYQPQYGYAELHIANVPGSATGASATIQEIQGPNGENVRYIFTNLGTAANPNYYLAQWNSSDVIPQQATPNTLTLEGNVPLSPAPPNTYWNGTAWAPAVVTLGPFGLTAGPPASSGLAGNSAPCYDWNITSPIEFTNTPTIAAASLTNNILWGWNSSTGWPTGTSAPSYSYQLNVTIWAISLAPANRGQLIYIKTISTETSDAQNILIERCDADVGTDGVFVTVLCPTAAFQIYNMRTGNLIATLDAQTQTVTPYAYFSLASLISLTQTEIAYNTLFTGGYSGSISAYNLATGALIWRYAVIPPGSAGNIKSSPGMIDMIADGMLFAGTHEHSAETPLEAGNDVKCLNATTGDLIWDMASWVFPFSMNVGDGVLTYWNNYDGQLYAIGQGPTRLTVTAPDTEQTVGTPLVIRGTVMDVSPGTQETAPKYDFPNGVPAVSDASESAWMEYVYMQKAEPFGTTGVPVTLTAIDPNGNTVTLGQTTSDSSGMFTATWAPTLSGNYTIIATFAGSNSYYGSSSETSIYAGAKPATTQTTPTPSPVSNVATMSGLTIGIAVAIIAIIIAIAIVGLLLLRRKP